MRHWRRLFAHRLREHAARASEAPDTIAAAAATVAWITVQLTLGVDLRLKAAAARKLAGWVDER